MWFDRLSLSVACDTVFFLSAEPFRGPAGRELSHTGRERLRRPREGQLISNTKYRPIRRVQQDGPADDHQYTHAIARHQSIEGKSDAGRSSGNRYIGKGLTPDLEVGARGGPGLTDDSPRWFINAGLGWRF